MKITETEHFFVIETKYLCFNPKKPVILKTVSGDERLVIQTQIRENSLLRTLIFYGDMSVTANDDREFYNASKEPSEKDFDLKDPDTRKYFETLESEMRKFIKIELPLTEAEMVQILSTFNQSKTIKECFAEHGFILK